VNPVWVGLRCVACDRLTPAAADLYVCPECGGNTLVEYDLDALKKTWSRESLPEHRPHAWRYLPILRSPGSRCRSTDAARPRAQLHGARLAQPLLLGDGRNPSASFKCRQLGTGRAGARPRS
jgi:threonine synthase